MGRKREPGSTTPQWVYTNDSIVAVHTLRAVLCVKGA